MLKLSEEAKKAYAKYVGPDGRLIIDPSLPDKVKEAFEFFNKEGINILELNINDEIDTELDGGNEELNDGEDFDYDEEEEFEEELEDDEDESVEESDINLNGEVSETDKASLNDLNDIF